MRAVTLTLLIINLLLVVSGRHFRLGRSKGGNLGSPGGYNGEELPSARWFTQKLDHSSAVDERVWEQRYFVNDSFYDFEKQGPVFLMIGGEGPANPRWMVKGAWIDYAKKFNALCLNLEHRYYGKSLPTSDLKTPNLQYLSSYQALSDLAYFIQGMNSKYNLDKHKSKWVVFGGSYPGSLAAWMRLKYPHLVHAAVSSSGPLLAKVDFKEYFEVVVNALREKTGNNECVTEIKEAHSQIADLIKSTPSIVEKEFKVCKPFSKASADDMKNFYNMMADDFADLVQYNEDNRITSGEKYKNYTINNVCQLLTEKTSELAYQKLAKFNAIVLAKSNESCMDYSYDNMINDLKRTNWNSDGARQWMYQTCTEFGFYQTSSGEVDVFGNKFGLDFFIQQCQDVFGKQFGKQFITNAAKWTNEKYGGLDISVTGVVFVHGSIDPWHALGLTTSIHDYAPAIFIHGTAHCADMYPKSKDDSSALIEARITILHHLTKWLVMEKP